MKEVEKFVFKIDHIGLVDEARVILFSKKRKPWALPLTSDAFNITTREAYSLPGNFRGKCLETSSLFRAAETLGWKKIADHRTATVPDHTRSDSENLLRNHFLLMFHRLCVQIKQCQRKFL